MGKVKIQKNEYQKIVDLYKNGMSQLVIAEMYNVCRDTIGKILKENGVDRFNKINPCDYNDIIRTYKEGTTQKEIAQKYNVSQGTISRIIKDNDVDWQNSKLPIVRESDYETVVNMYIGGMTQSEIAEKYNCSASTISAILRQNNIQTRLGGSKNTTMDVAKWAQMYKEGSLLSEIASKFGITQATVSRLLKKNGYNVDRFTYHFNEHYFDSVDTAEKAYILGLLWADGCNVYNSNSVILQLQEDDYELLEAINNLTENERPLAKQKLSKYNHTWKDCYKLTWHSKHLSDLLSSYGMIPQKTLSLEFPKWLHQHLHSHFIRGYFDGDGCISLSKANKNRSACVNMIGTKMFLNEVSNIIKNEIGVDVHVQRDERAKEPICVLRCSTRADVVKLLNWLYHDASIYMQRKHDKYQQFLYNINNSCCA